MRRRPPLAGNRTLAVLTVLGTLALAGCGESSVDPTATRTDAQADQLRTRLHNGQRDR